MLPRPQPIGRRIDAGVIAGNLSRSLPVGANGFAFLLSASVHVALALTLLSRAQRPASQVSPRRHTLGEIAVVDFVVVDARAGLARSAGAVRAPRYGLPSAALPSHDRTLLGSSIAHLPVARNVGDSVPAPAPTIADSPSPGAPRFVMTVVPTTGARGVVSPADGRAGGPGLAGADEPLSEALVDTAARLLAGTPPSYTREAEAAGVEADVPLEIVVDGVGAVIGARVLAHVGYGLDEVALASVRAYRFLPARRAGKALAVRMRWLMRFQL